MLELVQSELGALGQPIVALGFAALSVLAGANVISGHSHPFRAWRARLWRHSAKRRMS
ncbi:hypothetical+protein [Methylocapsa aurea]|jgi:hypothetical protein